MCADAASLRILLDAVLLNGTGRWHKGDLTHPDDLETYSGIDFFCDCAFRFPAICWSIPVKNQLRSPFSVGCRHLWRQRWRTRSGVEKEEKTEMDEIERVWDDRRITRTECRTVLALLLGCFGFFSLGDGPVTVIFWGDNPTVPHMRTTDSDQGVVGNELLFRCLAWRSPSALVSVRVCVLCVHLGWVSVLN